MRRRVIGIMIVIVIIVAGAVLLWIDSRAPAQSSVGVSNSPCSVGQACLRFPVISGDNLLGQSLTFPTDFKAKNVLVIVPFDENQQVSAQAWLPLAHDLASSHNDFAYYNVPVFPSMAAPMRILIRSGMSLSISDPQLRAITITVFLDNRDQFLSNLNIANSDTMQVFLLNGDGEVLWRGAGAFSSQQGDALRAALTG